MGGPADGGAPRRGGLPSASAGCPRLQAQKSGCRSLSGPSRLAAADADHVHSVRTGLERADNGWRHAQRIPSLDLDYLVIELGPTGARNYDVDLFLFVVPMTPRHARARLVGEAADAQLRRLERG